MRFIIGLAAVALAAGPAFGQYQVVIDKLNELNSKAPQPAMPEFEQAVAETAKAYSVAHNSCAPTSLKLTDIAPVTGARGILQAVMSGQMRNAWTVYAQHIGCAGDNPFRYLILQSPDGSLKALRVNEGRTLANPSIMRDTSATAALSALQKARSLDPTCKGESMAMGPTRVTERSKDLGPEIFGVRYVGNWTEVWQFQTCGKKIDVPILFTPDGDGGAYTVVKADGVTLVP
jgi:hypothetical protein